ncbi:Tubulin--tyrosine ligase [Acropora cervicornis]|uniref:Tubulin--tyrosine ligase n=1 Tax=Acropora cervicornis TaxID=6130 RepID=A0AAD9UV67_ACRCE|nr:Tubulin--tyrosine ligase [Acropora cervicornis]
MYTLVNRGEDSSVYKYITQLLVKGSAWNGKWKLGPKDYARFNLMFGERQTRVTFPVFVKLLITIEALRDCFVKKFVRSLTGHSDVKFSWLPVSYIVLPKRLKSKSETKSGYYTDEREEFLAFANKLEEKIWIAKSSSGSKGFVVQKYIENPLLLDGNRKFDIRYLKEKHQVSFASDILPQINTIVKKCLLGLKEELTTEGLGYDSFQLFGFDFMVDAKFHVWLLEVNGAPACANALLPALAEDLVRKAIDPIFPDHKSEEPRRSYQTQSITTESRKGGPLVTRYLLHP